MTSPLDRTLEFKMAFEKAEAAWLKWKRSPLGDAAYERLGETLLKSFIDAARTYLNYARHHTAVRRRDPSLYTETAAQTGPGAITKDELLDIPAFLLRENQ